MSDFMKHVVAEVLQRNRNEASAPAATLPAGNRPPGSCTGDGTCRPDCKETCSRKVQEPASQAALRRTNYQREKAGKRLAPLAGDGAGGGTSWAVPPTPGADAAGRGPLPAKPGAVSPGGGRSHGTTLSEDGFPVTKRFVEESLSPLLRLTMDRHQEPAAGSGGKAERTPSLASLSPTAAKAAPAGWGVQPSLLPRPLASGSIPDAAVPIGMADDRKEGFALWYFPVIREELRSLLGISNRRYLTAGLAAAATSHPRQLFAVEETLAAHPGLEPELVWGEPGKGFELKLFGTDAGAMMQTLTELGGKLRGSPEGIEAFVALEPSPLLVRYLGTRQQEALGVVTGVCRLNAIGLLDRLLQRHPDSKLGFRVEHRYLVLTGASDEVSRAVAEIVEEGKVLI